jgi:hypothetical protein
MTVPILTPLLPQGAKLIRATTNMSGFNNISITSLPAKYAYLKLVIVGASSGTTEQTLIRASVDNGSNYDTTASNYPGTTLTGTTLAAKAAASMVESTTHTSAQEESFTLYIFGYQGGGEPWYRARILQNGVEYVCDGYYIGSTSAINALRITGSGGGTWDAGTYTLYGIR